MTAPPRNVPSESGEEVSEDALRAILESLRPLTSSMLASFPDVQRWDQTDDVIQNAAIRSLLALRDSPPKTRRHFENLVALQVRRALIDLGRRYAIRVGMNRNRWTPSLSDSDCDRACDFQDNAESDPQGLIEWVELHEQIENLPDEEQEVFQLIWYRSLSKEEVAELINVDLRTVQRRWRSARETLASRYGGLPPL